MSAGSNALKKFYYETTVLRNSGPIPSQAAFDQQERLSSKRRPDIGGTASHSMFDSREDEVWPEETECASPFVSVCPALLGTAWPTLPIVSCPPPHWQ